IATAEFQGKRFWLDGTNFTSHALFVKNDISDRPALILDPKNLSLENIEWLGFKNNVFSLDTETEIKKNKLKIEYYSAFTTGAFAADLTGLEISQSKLQIENKMLKRILFNTSDVLEQEVIIDDLKERIVKPVSFKIKVKRKFFANETSMGPAISFGSGAWNDLYQADMVNRQAKFNLGDPRTEEYKILFKDVSAIGRKIKNCSVEGPHLSFSRKITYLPKGFRIEIVNKIKSRFIPAEDMRQSDFISFADKLRDCAKNQFVLYN
ncbi:MAG: hypothetical protein ACOYOK_08120, partial [Pseudobdellovibrionaceae bacterium]